MLVAGASRPTGFGARVRVAVARVLFSGFDWWSCWLLLRVVVICNPAAVLGAAGGNFSAKSWPVSAVGMLQARY